MRSVRSFISYFFCFVALAGFVGCEAELKTKGVATSTSPTTVKANLFGDLMACSAFRSDNSIDFLTGNVDGRIQPKYSDESGRTAAFIANANLVPNPEWDTDGYGDASHSGFFTFRNYLVSVKGRPTVVCGLSGTNDERIDDCAARNTTAGVNKASYEGSKYGLAGEGDWKLVTLFKAATTAGTACAGGSAAGCFEVWRDERTKLIWSDRHTNGGSNYNWFQAAGYSKSTSTTADTGLEGRAGVGVDCTGAPCQPATPISVCVDAASIAGLNGVATYQNPDGTNGTVDERPNKGNLTGAAHQWRLPTLDDYKLADVNGLRKVLPNVLGNSMWTASSTSFNINSAWQFSDVFGSTNYANRDAKESFRCVGR